MEGSQFIRRQITSRPTVTVQQIVDRLKVTPMTVTNWRLGSTKRRKLPWHQAPKGTKRHHVVIYETDLIRYLAEYAPELEEKWNTSTSKT